MLIVGWFTVDALFGLGIMWWVGTAMMLVGYAVYDLIWLATSPPQEGIGPVVACDLISVSTMKFTYNGCDIHITSTLHDPPGVWLIPLIEVFRSEPALHRILTTSQAFRTAEEAEQFGLRTVHDWIDKNEGENDTQSELSYE